MIRFLATHQRAIVGAAIAIAMLRAIALAAIYPFFINVDEDLHFDLVVRYSLGRIPASYDLFAPETLDWIGRYSSPEFLMPPDKFPGGVVPTPLWKLMPSEAEPVVNATKNAWRSEINFESSQPPLYYVLAGAWLKAGELAGLRGINALFWTRCANAIFIGGLVWVAYMAARKTYPADVEAALGVPLLIAFLPQQILFTITNDALSPLVCAAVFYCVIRAIRQSRFTTSAATLSGFLIAAAYLTKITNAPVIVVATVWLLVIAWRRRAAAAGLVLLVSAAAPICIWTWWSAAQFGDATGSTTKIALLGWRRKPISEWWNHPLFSLRGLWTFIYTLAATFWRGELKWHGTRLASPIGDLFCAVSSILLVISAVVGTIVNRARPVLQRSAIVFGIACLAASVGLLALLSIQFDFGRCVYPSRAFPYFASGRLIAGCITPFVLLYVEGLRRWLPRRIPGLLLGFVAAIIVFLTATDVLVNSTVASSEHNWLHR